MKHPAKFTKSILDYLSTMAPYYGAKILDPFAGVGGIHILQDSYKLFETWGVELEPEWASEHPRTIVGNALHLPFPDKTFDGIICSPTYANRLADKYDGRDGSKRMTYRISLGRMPSEGSSCTMQWGHEYMELHRQAWIEARRVASGFIVVNVSNHIRRGKEVDVVGFHRDALRDAGWKIRGIDNIKTPRMRMGANNKLRVSNEVVIRGE